MNLEPLSDDNFILFCARHYDSRLASSTKEFTDDLDRIKYIRKLITRYQKDDDLKERLILNHIIILSNVFPGEICSKILMFKLSDQAEYIKPFLLFLNILPNFLYNVGNQKLLNIDFIDMDKGIVEALGKLDQ